LRCFSFLSWLPGLSIWGDRLRSFTNAHIYLSLTSFFRLSDKKS
jgi:hypothetical protein